MSTPASSRSLLYVEFRKRAFIMSSAGDWLKGGGCGGSSGGGIGGDGDGNDGGGKSGGCGGKGWGGDKRGEGHKGDGCNGGQSGVGEDGGGAAGGIDWCASRASSAESINGLAATPIPARVPINALNNNSLTTKYIPRPAGMISRSVLSKSAHSGSIISSPGC